MIFEGRVWNMFNKFWWVIPAVAVVIAICWLSGLADGTSLLK